MSEKLLKILLEELKTLRLVCKSCGTATEYPVEKLSNVSKLPPCSMCSAEFSGKTVGQFHAVKSLALSLQSLATDAGFTVEFVLPDKD